MPDDINISLPDSVGNTLQEIYHDGLQPALKTFGKTLDLIPRTINCLLSPLELFLCKTEYSFEKSKAVISNKLKGIPAEDLTAPENYVAVPALQYLIYAIDSDELRNLYANLLAKAMYRPTKETVHPSFVEIIKQLSPVDANIFQTICESEARPLLALSAVKKNYTEHIKLELASTISATSNDITPWTMHSYDEIVLSLSTLERLGLIDCSSTPSYTDDKLYDNVRQTDAYKEIKQGLEEEFPTLTIEETKKMIIVKPVGIAFYQVCVSDIPNHDE